MSPPTNPAGIPRAAPEADAMPGRRGRSRRTPVLAGVGVAVLALAATLLAVPAPPPSPRVCGRDTAQRAALEGLAQYVGWLARYRVAGYVGEVGWPGAGPDAAAWQALGQTWYRAADRAGLPVTAWAAARWPADYDLRLYSAAPGSTHLGAAGAQAAVVERHATTDRYLRGVVVAGGSFGGNAFSSTHPGRYGYDYSYENADGYRYLAGRGVRLVRLAITWERVQPVPGGPLSGEEVARIRKAIGAAAAAGQVVILDLHGYGQFMLGTPAGTRALTLGTAALPGEALADVWRRLMAVLAGQPGLYGYDVLNEPLRLALRGRAGARAWEQMSQRAVQAIRTAGGTGPVFVAGYGQPDPRRWDDVHPRPWIQDPAGRVVYETHVYFDADNSGRYLAGYAAEAGRAGRTGRSDKKMESCYTFPDLSAVQTKVLGLPASLVRPVRGSLLERLAARLRRSTAALLGEGDA
jgi:hypothetical protein